MFNSFGLKIFYFLKGRGLKNDFSVGESEQALLQTLVVCWFVLFANVLFCALAVHYFDFLFLSLCSKLSAE